MNKSAACSRHFSHSHTGISASGIGGGGGTNTTLARALFVSLLQREKTLRFFLILQQQVPNAQ